MITDTELSRKRMVAGQVFTNRVLDANVLHVLEIIPRENFVPDNYKNSAYIDGHIPLGRGRFVLEPLVAAKILQAAKINSEDRVLIVDCGMGYLAALAAQIAKKVYAAEEDTEFLYRAKNNLKNIKITNAEVLPAIPSGGFDAILMNGAVEIFPSQLISNLNENGRLVIIKDGFVETVTKHKKSFSCVRGEQVFAPILPDFKKPETFSF